MRGKSTNELMDILMSAKNREDLETYRSELQKNDIQKSFPEFINEKIQERQVKLSDVIQKSQIQRNYAYQILDGKRNPGRNKVIALCIALTLNLEETQRALAIAGEGQLYSKNRRDAILIFAIQKKMTVLDVNEILSELGENLL